MHLDSRFQIPDSAREGQSLVEILIAVAIGIILVVGALSMVAPTLKTGADATRMQAGAAVGKELLDFARVLSEQNWHAVSQLSTTSANRYYVISSTSPFTAATGTESVLVSTTTYTRHFYLEDVYRNGSGKIDSSGTYDPSTRKITVSYSFGSTTGSFTGYIARNNDEVFTQDDWSGGSGDPGPMTATSVDGGFASSSNIDTSTTTGSIVIQGF